MCRNKITLAVAFLSVFTLLGSVLIAYWLIFPLKPVEMTTEKIIVLADDIQVGDRIPLEFSYCSNYTGAAEASYKLINGSVITFDLIKTQVERGCRTTIAETLVVPEYASEGEHKLRLEAWYKTSPITWKYLEFESETFNITK